MQDAVTGRFLSADPNIPDVSSPQDYNRYSYVDNNPVTYIDPSGFIDDFAGNNGQQVTIIGSTPAGPPGSVGNPEAPPGFVPTLNCYGTFYCVSQELETFPNGNQEVGTGYHLYTDYFGDEEDFNGDAVAYTPYTGSGPGYGGYDPIGGGGTPAGAPPQKQQGPSPQGEPHYYHFNMPTSCPAAQAFNGFRQPDISGPGAPLAQEGTTPGIPLIGVFSPNPITQNVNPATFTITNVTDSTHILYDGSVTISVTPQGSASNISITGQGVNSYSQYASFNDAIALFNEFVAGPVVFGFSAFSVANGCELAAGAYYVSP